MGVATLTTYAKNLPPNESQPQDEKAEWRSRNETKRERAKRYTEDA